MKKVLLTALLALPFAAFAQELKQVTKEYQNPYYKEEYSVLKSDKKVKEGKYVKSAGNAVIQTGFYKNDKKDSTWVAYSKPRKVESKGNFKNGLRIGVWEFFDENGQLESSYDYIKNQPVFLKEENGPKEFLVKSGSDFIPKELNRKPVSFPSHEPSNENDRIKYPIAAMRQGIAGTVLVSWVIDENGKGSEPKIEKGLGYGCDEEALRVANFVRNQVWIPGMLNGQPVAVKYTLPVKFGVQ